MFYRRAGIRHTRYQDERQLFPMAFDRVLVLAALAFLLLAPYVVDRLYVVGYLLPWLIWTSAALGLNLLMGGAGQIHDVDTAEASRTDAEAADQAALLLAHSTHEEALKKVRIMAANLAKLRKAVIEHAKSTSR